MINDIILQSLGCGYSCKTFLEFSSITYRTIYRAAKKEVSLTRETLQNPGEKCSTSPPGPFILGSKAEPQLYDLVTESAYAVPVKSMTSFFLTKYCAHRTDALNKAVIHSLRLDKDDNVLEIGYGRGNGLKYCMDQVADGDGAVSHLGVFMVNILARIAGFLVAQQQQHPQLNMIQR
ncbi:unnamed protein product [Nippostrongylus brasiliensis]|uniref:Type II protein arginine methyltransferase n=1 Tax=Nippostrongylus brasiliensis TaxID=27835 RepID=A0A0N4XFE6_NIPBR|nr:unnamed protein product [Nippostrongylus brasiliensis]